MDAKVKERKSAHKYSCSFEWCGKYCDELHENELENHLWEIPHICVQLITSFTKDLTLKKFAFFRSILHHLFEDNQNYKIPRILCINPHQFPTSLLLWRRMNPRMTLSTPLSITNADDIPIDNFSHNWIYNESNLVFHLHNHQLKR